MTNIKLYYHGGSKNHGCEAIVRSTKKILNCNISLFSTASEEDYQYGLDEIVSIFDDKENSIKEKSLQYFFSALQIKLKNKTILNTKYRRINLINKINKDDICLSIGGDNYCYSGVEKLGDLNYLIKKKHAKTVLWGCSIDPAVLNRKTIEDLKRYDLITVRETLTKDGLLKNGIKANVKLFPDPAFQLDKIDLPLPTNFISGNTVGINISPLVIDSENSSGITYMNFSNLIKYIINETDMNIVLVPHVVKSDSDDRKPLLKLYNEYKASNRICILDDYNCMELKGFISRCRFFIGSRTHATIAAYSTNVPTLVIGYSIKAKGIAKDIFGTYENYVIPVQSLAKEEELISGFDWLMKHENSIKEHLETIMPKYIEQSLKAGDEIRRFLNDK